MLDSLMKVGYILLGAWCKGGIMPQLCCVVERAKLGQAAHPPLCGPQIVRESLILREVG